MVSNRQGAAVIARDWEYGAHSLKCSPHIISRRDGGPKAGIELAPRAGKPGGRGFDTFLKAYESDLLVRVTGDIIALSPPLICEKKHIDDIFGILGDVLKKVD